jgi:DNA repair exonuclease SbcCD nuclease subunit
MISLVFTSDNHLNRYYAKMTREQLRQRRRRIREAWKKTVDFAIQHKVNFYLHGGDLFDSPDPSPGELAAVAHEFQRLRDANISVLCISGNHDMPRAQGEGATPVRIYEELRAARVFKSRVEVEFATFQIDGTRIAIGGLAPDPRAGGDADPLDDVKVEVPEADVSLLILHCGVEDAVPPDFDNAVLHKKRIAELDKVDYFLCGDIHKTSKQSVAHATVLVPGATERMTFGEQDDVPGFYYLEFDGSRLSKAIRHKIEPQPMDRFEIRTTDLPGDAPNEYVFEGIRDKSKRDQLLQMRMGGPLARETYHALRWFDIWSAGSEHNFFFDLDRAAVHLRADNNQSIHAGEERVSTTRELELVADELSAKAESNDERDILESARELVLSRYKQD